MRDLIFRNKFYIIMISLFIIFGFLSIIPLKRYEENQADLFGDYERVINLCKSTPIEDMSEFELENCNFYLEVINSTEFNMTASNAYDMFVFDFYRNYINEFIVILIIVVCSTYFVTKYLRNRTIINNINRENYKSIKKKLFISSWRYSLLVPIMLIIVFILTFIMTGNGDNGYPYLENTIFENNILLYFFFIVIQSFILTFIHTNITLIISRKEHNYILSVIKSFVCIVGISLFVEIVNTNIIFGLFNASRGIDFNIFEMYDLFDKDDVVYNLMWNLIMLAISFVILFISYKNKEKLIIDSEKNDNKNEE